MKIEPIPEGTGALIARMAADDRKAASALPAPETAGPASSLCCGALVLSPVSSAETFHAWLCKRGEKERAKASTAWKDKRPEDSDFYAANACALEDAADDFRREMGLPESRQPEENRRR